MTFEGMALPFHSNITDIHIPNHLLQPGHELSYVEMWNSSLIPQHIEVVPVPDVSGLRLGLCTPNNAIPARNQAQIPSLDDWPLRLHQDVDGKTFAIVQFGPFWSAVGYASQVYWDWGRIGAYR
ncbi:hypothetical protein D9758_016347 [Tetrapyrgos nigripes]|uniref:Uncharacterized protein n=1 Tax=Tetrapyrgos nigripes TaxID=182062 RepID=A0A8H5BYA6_9AGAR|nr:hypothetical protein D9758_016347 [Tetrapyrgos nigripes]